MVQLQVMVWTALTVILCCYLEMVQPCSCVLRHPQVQYCSADYVIRANIHRHRIVTKLRVLEINDTEEYTAQDGSESESEYIPIASSDDAIVWTVKVKKVYKGKQLVKSGQVVELWTPKISTMCGVTHLRIGESYVLTGMRRYGEHENQLSTSVCDWNEQWKTVKKRNKNLLRSLYKNNCGCSITICYNIDDIGFGFREDEFSSQCHDNTSEFSEVVEDPKPIIDGCTFKLESNDAVCYAEYSACEMKEDGSCDWNINKNFKKCLDSTKPERGKKPKRDKKSKKEKQDKKKRKKKEEEGELIDFEITE
ncbi:metalloproteinase inhibitor 2-like [Saccoglossus kowalevskii]